MILEMTGILAVVFDKISNAVFRNVSLDHFQMPSNIQTTLNVKFDAPFRAIGAPGELETMQSLVKDLMESAYPMRVPLLVDMGWGEHWLEAH